VNTESSTIAGMSETSGRSPRRLGRSVGAIFAGFVAVVVLSLGTDFALHATGIFPPWRQAMSDVLFLLATVYRTVYGIAGAYITARLAPRRPMLHAMVGCAVGMVVASAGAIATWNRGPEFGPHWYPIALIVLGPPTAWVGGRLREIEESKAVR
jgi:drug/metabolite transporter (DMT)-like permease